jgi:hypothetical protein
MNAASPRPSPKEREQSIEEIVLIYPVKRSTLAKLVYCVSSKTFKVWLDDIDITHQHTLTPADLQKIVDTYHLPKGVTIMWLGGKIIPRLAA